MHRNDRLALQRIDRLSRDRLAGALYRATAPLTITAWEVPGEPVPFADALAAEYGPFEVGQAWGRPWGTVWFHVTGTVPAGWREQAGTLVELVADLGFDASAPGFQAEALVYRPDGSIVKAIEPRNAAVPIEADQIDLYIEAAANPSVAGTFTFEPTPLGDPATAGGEPLYRLTRLDLGLHDREVWELTQDVVALRGLVDELDPARTRHARVIAALGRAVDALDPDDVAGTAAEARAALRDVLDSPAAASSHRITAVGHAHIDSAWLWPVRETARKVARTFANVLDLIERDEEFVFAASSAQQYAWLEEHQPALFSRLAEAVRAGRFVPVGGMWVESDTNMPGSEALARQFIEGKRFFLEKFGVEPLEVWLPDSFGYSAALPQIIAQAGSRWFLTQKISWNETNRMPHHTFLWEGIDGTRVFTHFPPVDTYNSDLSAADLARAERQFAEKAHTDHSLVPFGWGDGGGGPTREMVAAARRTADLEGSPRVRMAAPETFFREAEAEYPDPPVWSGELYLEYHRGSYSAQARTKRGNRRSEHLLRAAELWATLATVRTGAAYPAERLRRLWRTVLLQQFHDILPGTSIAWVHQEAEQTYAAVAAELAEIIDTALATLAGEGTLPLAANAAPVVLSDAPALGAAAAAEAAPASVRATDDGWVLEHPRARWLLDARGAVVGGHDLVADRHLVDPSRPAGVLQLFRDTPRDWDAWNIDAEDAALGTDLRDAESVSTTADGAGVVVIRRFGASRVEQEFRVDAASGALDITVRLDWHERQKMLKLAFPLQLRAERTESEIQFGHVSRPVHANTTWDAAKFETVAHRWIRVVEGGYGVSIANDASYGHDVRRGDGAAGGAHTVARVTLVRAPLFPDPGADQGRHEFTVSLRPGADVADAVADGFRLNLPPVQLTGARPIEPALTVDDRGVVVEAVKLADDGSGDVVVRLYEARGSPRRAPLRRGFAWAGVEQVDLLERPVAATVLGTVSDGTIALHLQPFQLATLRLRRSALSESSSVGA
ncbi:glycoside hydrolase family 38 C-terminal domain-containing protein [Microbacterium sp. zg.Y1084]|uniref:alpha-mannosidase n=1 Tax=Microbacterium sp. zg.Y1084 TaxID=2969667 RepID=UPI00214BAC36|nr:glycoside hydrolase family 38 C-terminal domain-containing protein [Microbacterium sp. zg.Y1084]MCR2812664.1 glycosyl hydrolase-related protein [Microbacterium sp. zg.Y1084]